MKKFRKGFTLVELLIVIAILGTLSAMMATSAGNATVRAKVAQIVSNVEACKTAAALYYSDNYDSDNIGAVTASAFLYDGEDEGAKKYVPNFKDFATGGITYTVVKPGSNASGAAAFLGKGRNGWAIYVNFMNDVDADAIDAMLSKAKGYSDIQSMLEFTVHLTTGEID